MPRTGVGLRLEGGYSRFLRGSVLQVHLEEGPARLSARLPAALLQRGKPLEFRFRLRRAVGGRTGGLGWKITPQHSLRALVLFERNAFLGNFRVPRNRIGIQWDVEAQAEGRAGRGQSLLLGLQARSRLLHSWVTFFPRRTNLGRALRQAWSAYRSPFSASEAARLLEGQVVRWRWSGRLTFSGGIEWSLVGGWALPEGVSLSRLQANLGQRAGLGVDVETSVRGQFSLQVRRREGLELRIRRQKSKVLETSLEAGLAWQSRVRLGRLVPGPGGWLGPLAAQLERPLRRAARERLRQALERRLEIALVLARQRWKGSETLLEARWKLPSGPGFRSQYGSLLSGGIPASREGMKLAGRLEEFHGRRQSLRLHVLDWLGLEHSHARESRMRLSVTPTGELLLEKTLSAERSRSSWQGAQMLRLWYRRSQGKGAASESYLWSYRAGRRFTRASLERLLDAALRAGILQEYALPAPALFPLRAELLFVTRFSPAAVRALLRAGQRARFQALVRAFELSAPGRYRRGRFWRDWIESEALRALVARDPVQAHLASRYPIPGRTRFERLQVVAQYARVRRFLALLGRARPAPREVLRVLDGELPIFFFFHLMTPAALRRSALLMTGEIEQQWGDQALIEEAVAG